MTDNSKAHGRSDPLAPALHPVPHCYPTLAEQLQDALRDALAAGCQLRRLNAQVYGSATKDDKLNRFLRGINPIRLATAERLMAALNLRATVECSTPTAGSAESSSPMRSLSDQLREAFLAARKVRGEQLVWSTAISHNSRESIRAFVRGAYGLSLRTMQGPLDKLGLYVVLHKNPEPSPSQPQQKN